MPRGRDGRPELHRISDRFPIKVMGRRGPRRCHDRRDRRHHAPDFDPATLEMRASKKNSYLSVTCTVRATSREQLDSLSRSCAIINGGEVL